MYGVPGVPSIMKLRARWASKNRLPFTDEYTLEETSRYQILSYLTCHIQVARVRVPSPDCPPPASEGLAANRVRAARASRLAFYRLSLTPGIQFHRPWQEFVIEEAVEATTVTAAKAKSQRVIESYQRSTL
jgi:hypothetical protein